MAKRNQFYWDRSTLDWHDTTKFSIFYYRTKTHENAPIFAGDGTDETCAMDVAVLIAFPCVFLIFNIVYWAAFHLWGQKFTKTAIVEGCGVPTSLSHTLCYAACCWAAFSSYSHNGLVFCIEIKNQAEETTFFFLLFLINPNYHFPSWFWIV